MFFSEIKNLIPDKTAPSPEMIDYKRLYDMGIRGVIFDIDNTLVMHGAPANARCIDFVHLLKKTGITPFILSNNERSRVESFANTLGVDFIFKANKPSREGYFRACSAMGLEPESVAAVGDQIFTDILGAKRSGIHAILVSPVDPREELQIKLKRLLEKPIIALLATQCYHEEENHTWAN